MHGRSTRLAGAGALWGLWVTIGPRLLGIVATCWGTAHGGTSARLGGLHTVSSMRSGWGPMAGVTIGDVFLTGMPAGSVTAELRRHESMHVRQWRLLGPAFPLLYAANWLVARRAADNVFEIAAGLDSGGYGPPATRWQRWADDVLHRQQTHRTRGG